MMVSQTSLIFDDLESLRAVARHSVILFGFVWWCSRGCTEVVSLRAETRRDEEPSPNRAHAVNVTWSLMMGTFIAWTNTGGV